MKINNTNMLKPGDIIRFHNWGVGGFLFGVITECEKEPHTENTIHIWREKSTFSLNNVDNIELIEKIEDVQDYTLHDFYDFLNDMKKNNISNNFDSHK